MRLPSSPVCCVKSDTAEAAKRIPETVSSEIVLMLDRFRLIPWPLSAKSSAREAMAARTSERLGQFKPEETARIITLLERAGLPVTGPQVMSAQAYLPHMWIARCS